MTTTNTLAPAAPSLSALALVTFCWLCSEAAPLGDHQLQSQFEPENAKILGEGHTADVTDYSDVGPFRFPLFKCRQLKHSGALNFPPLGSFVQYEDCRRRLENELGPDSLDENQVINSKVEQENPMAQERDAKISQDLEELGAMLAELYDDWLVILPSTTPAPPPVRSRKVERTTSTPQVGDDSDASGQSGLSSGSFQVPDCSHDCDLPPLISDAV